MLLIHITDADTAEEIIESKTFIAAPLLNDDGINCFDLINKYKVNQSFSKFGVKLQLDWSGPVSQTAWDAPPPLQPGILHVQPPWRCFVRGPIGSTDMRIVKLVFDEPEQAAHCRLNQWQALLPAAAKSQIVSKKQRVYFDKLNEKILKGIFITIK